MRFGQCRACGKSFPLHVLNKRKGGGKLCDGCLDEQRVTERVEGAALEFVRGVYVAAEGVEVGEDPWGDPAFCFPSLGLTSGGQWASLPGWLLKEDFDSGDALSEFVKIRDSRGALEFAGRYGPMWICRRHPEPCFWRPPVPGQRSQHGWDSIEPVSAWLGEASRMRAVLVATDRLKAGNLLRPDDWRGLKVQLRAEALPADLQSDKILLSEVVNDRLRTFGVGVQLNALELQFNAGLGFLPAVWQQLAALVGGGKALAICRSCGGPFIALRKPKRGQLSWCAECRSRRSTFHYQSKTLREPDTQS